MEMPYASIRTYYTRVYEAKFITARLPVPWRAGTASAMWPTTPASACLPTSTHSRSARG